MIGEFGRLVLATSQAAARFLNDVKGYLANPGRLLLAP